MYLSDKQVLNSVKEYLLERKCVSSLDELKDLEVLESTTFDIDEFIDIFENREDAKKELVIPSGSTEITGWILSATEIVVKGELYLPEYLAYAAGTDDNGEFVDKVAVLMGDEEGFNII